MRHAPASQGRKCRRGHGPCVLLPSPIFPTQLLLALCAKEAHTDSFLQARAAPYAVARSSAGSRLVDAPRVFWPRLTLAHRSIAPLSLLSLLTKGRFFDVQRSELELQPRARDRRTAADAIYIIYDDGCGSPGAGYAVAAAHKSPDAIDTRCGTLPDAGSVPAGKAAG